jgi:hypothetical protein
MKHLEMEKLLNDPCLRMLIRGEWKADDLVVWPLFRVPEKVKISGLKTLLLFLYQFLCHIFDLVFRRKVVIYPGLKASIVQNWNEVKKKNPEAFPGPTIRLANYHRAGDTLVVEVVPSDYSEGQFLGWQGVAMIPVTSDGFIVMQASVKALAASIGEGIRVPGCTPPHARVVDHIIKEMEEEFATQVTKDQLRILGICEILPPAAKRNNGIIARVDLKETFAELKEKWQDAEDKWEGEILPLELTRENILAAVKDERYARASKLLLLVVAESLGII